MKTESCSSHETGCGRDLAQPDTRLRDRSLCIPSKHIMRHGQGPSLVFVILQT